MRRFVFPMALWVYVSVDRALQGVGAALYFGRGWEMCLVWLVALVFLGMVGGMVLREPRQRALILSPPPLPTLKEAVWNLFLLLFFTGFLFFALNNLQHWWEASWVDMWFKIVFSLVQLSFWCVAGRWWRDMIQTLIQISQRNVTT